VCVEVSTIDVLFIKTAAVIFEDVFKGISDVKTMQFFEYSQK